MSQLNNENFNMENNQQENNKKVKQKNKNVNYSLRNTVIFLLIFMIICIGITIFFIFNAKKQSNKNDTTNSVTESIKESIIPDNLGITSKYETFTVNPVNFEKIYLIKGTDENAEVSYVSIDGLKDKNIQESINNAIKSEVMDLYSKNKKGVEITAKCYASFSNVMSVLVQAYGNSVHIEKGLNFNLVTGDILKFEDLFTNNANIRTILNQSYVDSYKQFKLDGIIQDELTTNKDVEYYDKEYEKSIQERLSDIESKVFKFVNDYRNGEKFEFYFTNSSINIINKDIYIVKIKMSEYFNDIAIYNRYKNENNIYDGKYDNKDILGNSNRMIFINPMQENVCQSFIMSEPIPIDNFGVFKLNEDVICALLIEGNNIDHSTEKYKQLINVVKEKMTSYAKLNDEKGHWIQMTARSDAVFDEVSFEIIDIVSSSKNMLLNNALDYYQEGNPFFYVDKSSLKDSFYLKNISNINLNEHHSYLDKSLIYKYNNKTKKWENGENINHELVPEVTTNNNVGGNKTIVIDPGHQSKANNEKEPIGPGATQTKAKVTGGTTGIVTKQTEYDLNLKVSKKLKAALEAKGYNVIMTRSTNDVNLSNSERAQIANNANADVFIRIHGNSVDNQSVKGALTMCQTSSNKYNGNLASKSYALSKAVIDEFCNATNAVNKGVTRTDEMSGINWCKVPTTILEMGFMSNPEEDKNLANDEYQNKIVIGIVNGIEKYLNS